MKTCTKNTQSITKKETVCVEEIFSTCCFSGPRPKNYPWGNDKEGEVKIAKKLNIAVQEAIKRGYRHFISGMAAGIDLIAASIVVQFRDEMPDKKITLHAAIPFPEQPRRWSETAQKEYLRLVSLCNSVYVFSDLFSIEAYAARDKYMVDSSSLLIAVEGKNGGGTARTVAYAQQCGKEIVLIKS